MKHLYSPGIKYKYLFKSSLICLGLNAVKELSAIDQAHYPEMIRKVYVVNAPSIFQMFWKICAPWLDKRTIEKVNKR
jgi:hypothetical protein